MKVRTPSSSTAVRAYLIYVEELRLRIAELHQGLCVDRFFELNLLLPEVSLCHDASVEWEEVLFEENLQRVRMGDFQVITTDTVLDACDTG